MERIHAPQEIDKTEFTADADGLQAKYGLPQEVKFCKSCVISNQRPNSAIEYSHTKQSKKATIHFDENGICDACNFAEKKE